MQGMHSQSLVGELGSHVPLGADRKKKRKNFEMKRLSWIIQ